jgi:hypothetical protein
VIRLSLRLLAALTFIVVIGAPAHAQEDDAVLKPAEPDFTLVNLPTSLRLPLFGSGIRITHRFTRPLKCDECPNSLLGDALGTDNGAVIGLEYRIGLIPNGQLVFHRSRLDKTIQFLGEYGIARQRAGMPLEIAALLSVEGTQNFRGVYSPSIGLALSHLVGETFAVHVDPIFVHNSNLTSDVGDDDTFVVGLGGRLRISSTVYIVGEVAPRVTGYNPGKSLGSFALEKRLGGHLFQLTFTNYYATTLRQIAQGAQNNNNWYLGFNLTRKFF